MWIRIFLLCTTLFVVSVYTAETSTRPKNCSPGTTYNKDCNVCTCQADGKDKCSQIDCSRQNTTHKPKENSGTRPGVCPTKVDADPASDFCKKKPTSCKIDKDCYQAKKCCEDGCKKYQCRNAIYKNTP